MNFPRTPARASFFEGRRRNSSRRNQQDAAATPPSQRGTPPLTIEQQVYLAGGDVAACNCRHSPAEGVHRATDLVDAAGYTFPYGDAQVVGKDGKIMRISRLQASQTSEFLAVAFFNPNFAESNSREIKVPIFNTTQIVDAFELSSWILVQWSRDRKYPALDGMSVSCAFNVMRVAAFFQMHPLLETLRKTILSKVPAEDLIAAYRQAEIADSELAQALWKRILAEFQTLYRNGSYLQFSAAEINDLLKDVKLNVKAAQVYEVLEGYIRASNSGPHLSNSIRRQQIDHLFGRSNVQAFEHVSRHRVPYEVIIAQAGRDVTANAMASVEIYDPVRKQWTLSKSLEAGFPRMFHKVCSLDDGILFSGGYDGQRFFRASLFYNFEEMKWNPVCSMMDLRCYSSLAQLDGARAIACGGFNGQLRLKSAEIYDYGKNQWKKVAAMWEARTDPTAVAIPETNNVYVAGGFNGAYCLSTVEVYSTEKNEWFRQLRRMNQQRTGHGALLLNDNVLIMMGGSDGARRLRSTEMYDIREGSWHQLADLSTPRTSFGCVVFEGSPWLIGGQSDPMIVAECERFEIRQNTWLEASSMNAARTGVACCTVKNVDWIEKVLRLQEEEESNADNNNSL